MANGRRLRAALLLSLLMHLLLLADPADLMSSAGLTVPDASPSPTSATLHAMLHPAKATRPSIRPPAPRPTVPAAPSARRRAMFEIAPSEPSSATPQTEPPSLEAAPPVPTLPVPEPESMPEPTLAVPEEAIDLTAHGATVRPAATEARLMTTLHFSVTRGEKGFVIGEAIHRIELADDQYRLSADLATTGLVALLRPVHVRQLSIGRYQNGVLMPLTFRNERQDESEEARFDWSAGHLRLADGRTLPLLEGTQDLLSLFYQLAAFESATSLELPVATTRKLEYRRLTNLGREQLVTPLGERWTIHWRIGEGHGSSEAWIDEETRLPVKILFIDHRGDLYQQHIEALNVEPSKNP